MTSKIQGVILKPVARGEGRPQLLELFEGQAMVTQPLARVKGKAGLA